MKRKQGPVPSSNSQAKKTKPTLGTDTIPPAVLSLQELLDFSQVKTEEDIERRFNYIAKALLHEFHLVVVVKHDNDLGAKEIEFEILEAELYLRMSGQTHVNGRPSPGHIDIQRPIQRLRKRQWKGQASEANFLEKTYRGVNQQ